jgi:hypothetical protein
MAQVYYTGGIAVEWIANPVDGQVEVYSGPCPPGCRSYEVFEAGHEIAVVAGGAEGGRIAVSDILP